MRTIKTYWKSIPKTSLAGFLLGVFLIFSTIGFASDIVEMGRQPMPRFVMSILMAGIFPVFYAFIGFALRKQFWKGFLPVFAVHFFLMGLLTNRFPSSPLPAQMDAAAINQMHSRLTFDALAIMIAVGLGYGCFLYVSITEFRRYFRVHAEIELASEIHRVLVPSIDTRIGGFEFCGRSSPSGEVGGDLIDLARSLGRLCRGCVGPRCSPRRSYGHGQECQPDATELRRGHRASYAAS